MKAIDKFLIAIICVFVGVLATLQFRTVQSNYLNGLLPSSRSDQLRAEVIALREDKAKLADELTAREEELAYITKNSADENALIKNIQLQLDRYKMISGLTDVTGEGIIVYIDNPIIDGETVDSTANIVNNAYLITSVINELNAAGAEAISVNDERIIATTAIRRVGDEININGRKYLNPIAIKAIGNGDVLFNAIGARFQIVESLRNAGYQVEVKKVSDISIYKYDDVINWRYAQPK